MRSFYLSRDPYTRGFEDACKLILMQTIQISKTEILKTSKQKLRYILSLRKIPSTNGNAPADVVGGIRCFNCSPEATAQAIQLARESIKKLPKVKTARTLRSHAKRLTR